MFRMVIPSDKVGYGGCYTSHFTKASNRYESHDVRRQRPAGLAMPSCLQIVRTVPRLTVGWRGTTLMLMVFGLT